MCAGRTGGPTELTRHVTTSTAGVGRRPRAPAHHGRPADAGHVRGLRVDGRGDGDADRGRRARRAGLVRLAVQRVPGRVRARHGARRRPRRPPRLAGGRPRRGGDLRRRAAGRRAVRLDGPLRRRAGAAGRRRRHHLRLALRRRRAGLRARTAAAAVRRVLRRLGAAGAGRPAARRPDHHAPGLAVGVPRAAAADHGGPRPPAARPAPVGGAERVAPPPRPRGGGGRCSPGPASAALQYAGQRLDLLALGLAAVGVVLLVRRPARAAAGGHARMRPGLPAVVGGARPARRRVLRDGRPAPAVAHRAARLQPDRGRRAAHRRGARLGGRLAAAGPPSAIWRAWCSLRLGFVLLAAGLAGHRARRRARAAGLAVLPDLGGRRARYGAGDAEPSACCCSVSRPSTVGVPTPPPSRSPTSPARPSASASWACWSRRPPRRWSRLPVRRAARRWRCSPRSRSSGAWAAPRAGAPAVPAAAPAARDLPLRRR